MQEAVGNLWDFQSLSENHFAVITTNGLINKRGECIMGRGCAKEAKEHYAHLRDGYGLARILGDAIRSDGNKVYTFWKLRLVTFPTKHKWFEKSDINLIKHSAEVLAKQAMDNPDKVFYLVRPGCGNGQLLWKDVKPVIESILPDNVVVITNNG